MPGDEVSYEATEAGSRNRTGPRHAAPKKPLITRLNMPAGKAIAIAAMPTSILMGMGLTPTLAHAKPVPDNPFRDGPCVTAPDKEAEEAEEKDKAEAEKAEKAAEDAKGEAKDETPSEGDEPTPSPSTGDGDKAAGGQADEPEPEPSPSESKNPLDPLGVGDAIKDFFTPDDPTDDKESEEPAPEPSASQEPASEGGKSDATDPVEDTVDGAKDAVGKVTDGAKDAADKAKDTVDGLKPAEDTDPLAPDADGKKPFPCVEEKKVAGDDEVPPAPIPEDPWHLKASSLLLKGADYEGIVNLKTPSGKTKQVMKYVISKGTDIGDLHQTVEGPGGETYHIKSAKGATSTIRGGKTIMYTERLSGHLFGLIPVTFDPEHPPPLNIPTIYLTNVEAVQAAQFGGNLTVPGFHQEITD
ncbi:hypothetical protein QIS99_07510 [Streptomyces sp. B-S-A8]|uniref:Hydrogenase expression protein HypF n=1 Tax=Streptomyces solicavernae TaxID=3043614 RepID=A0ABT6RNW0_9ACTN|nr:hypothetical protein [Streptomyces sp. B-S-A8]MDI3386065.1 hypothetical protein [Streptomyces sp. B-S-A8]